MRDHVLHRQRDLRGLRQDRAARGIRRPLAPPFEPGDGRGSYAACDGGKQQQRQLHERLPDDAVLDGLQLFGLAVRAASREVSRRAVLRHGNDVHERLARRIPLPGRDELEQDVPRRLPQLVLLLGGGWILEGGERLGVSAGRAVVLDGQDSDVHGRVHLDRHRLPGRSLLVRHMEEEAGLHRSRRAGEGARGGEGARVDARGHPHVQHGFPRPGRLQEGFVLALPVEVASRLPDGAYPAALDVARARRRGHARVRLHERGRGGAVPQREVAREAAQAAGRVGPRVPPAVGRRDVRARHARGRRLQGRERVGARVREDRRGGGEACGGGGARLDRGRRRGSLLRERVRA